MNIATKTFKEKAWMFAYFSYIAYMMPRDGINAFAKFGFDATFIDCGGSQAFWLVNDDDLVIVCRGTELTELEDLTASFDFRLVNATPWPGKIHAGFFESINDIWPTLLQLLNKYPNRKIWLCGHSLGGAMSALLAYKLKRTVSITTPEEIYTYGCPKIGNQEFVESLNTTDLPHYRFVNSTDVVTNVPPGGYEHFGTLYYMNKDGDIVSPTWLQTVKDRARGVMSGELSFFNNHRISRYVNNLYKWMKSSQNLM